MVWPPSMRALHPSMVATSLAGLYMIRNTLSLAIAFQLSSHENLISPAEHGTAVGFKASGRVPILTITLE